MILVGQTKVNHIVNEKCEIVKDENEPVFILAHPQRTVIQRRSANDTTGMKLRCWAR